MSPRNEDVLLKEGSIQFVGNEGGRTVSESLEVRCFKTFALVLQRASIGR